MNDKILLIVNPRSGRGKSKEVLFDIVDTLTHSGKTVTVYTTKQKKQTIDYIAENVQNYDTVAACGGDGTLNECFNGVIKSGVRVPIGYIPLGSTNDFATSLNLPLDHIEAAKVVAAGKSVPYDVGSLNGSYFTYIACAGAFAETSYLTAQNLKNKIGHSAYLLSAFKSISTLKKTTMEITTSDFTLKDDFLFTSFSNSLNAGVVLNFNSNDIKFDDGLFELLLVKMPKDIIDFTSLVKDILNANFNNKLIRLFKTSECHVKAEVGIGWSLDGEDGGITDEITLKVHPKAVDIIRR